MAVRNQHARAARVQQRRVIVDGIEWVNGYLSGRLHYIFDPHFQLQIVRSDIFDCRSPFVIRRGDSSLAVPTEFKSTAAARREVLALLSTAA